MHVLYNLKYITLQHVHHGCTTCTSHLYNMYITAVQLVHHSCTTCTLQLYNITAVYNLYITAVQHVHHICTICTSQLYNMYITVVQHVHHSHHMLVLYNLKSGVCTCVLLCSLCNELHQEVCNISPSFSTVVLCKHFMQI